MSETKHTPTPWRACRIENETCIIDGSERLIIDCDRRYSSVPDAEHAANIAMIVRAANARDALVSALEAMLEVSACRAHMGAVEAPVRGCDCCVCVAAVAARAALRAARGEA